MMICLKILENKNCQYHFFNVLKIQVLVGVQYLKQMKNYLTADLFQIKEKVKVKVVIVLALKIKNGFILQSENQIT